MAFFAPARAIDIIYTDPASKKDETLKDATITKDTTEGITAMVPGKGEVKISALNIKDVVFKEDDVKPLVYTDFRRPFVELNLGLAAKGDAERLKQFQAAIPAFDELIKKVPRQPTTLTLRRYLDFKAAETKARIAKLDPKEGKAAIDALNKFKTDYTTGWQMAPVLVQLAQMQEDRNEIAAVQETYAALAALPGVSEEMKRSALFRTAQALIRAEKFPEAKTRLEDLKRTLPPEDPNALPTEMLLAHCLIKGSDAEAKQGEEALKALLGRVTDPAVKAQAYNTLGDYYQRVTQPEEAFWSYLRVHVSYPDDKNEHARALFHLSKLFREVKKDANKANDCLELLKTERFAGLEYQKKVQDK